MSEGALATMDVPFAVVWPSVFRRRVILYSTLLILFLSACESSSTITTWQTTHWFFLISNHSTTGCKSSHLISQGYSSLKCRAGSGFGSSIDLLFIPSYYSRKFHISQPHTYMDQQQDASSTASTPSTQQEKSPRKARAKTFDIAIHSIFSSDETSNWKISLVERFSFACFMAWDHGIDR